MKKALFLSTLAASSLMAFNASAQDILAKVLSSTPVVQQVAVPRQVCSNQQVVTPAPKSGAGALLGAVAGGAAGNAIGNGSGRTAATFIGLVGGALIGDRIEGGGSNQVQNVQQCTTQTFFENRASHFNVVYEYQGTQYNVQMAQDPGPFIKLQVTPVGASNPGSAPPAQPRFQQPPLQPLQPTQPQTFLDQEPVQYAAQPVVVVRQPVYAAPIVVQQAPVYFAQPISAQPYYVRPHFARPYVRPYVRPYYGPALNIHYNYGYGRGYGPGYWR